MFYNQILKGFVSKTTMGHQKDRSSINYATNEFTNLIFLRRRFDFFKMIENIKYAE